LEYASIPYQMNLHKQAVAGRMMQERDANLLKRLTSVGFLLDWTEDATNTVNYLTTGSGTYLDVGASQLIANGSIKIKTGCISGVGESGLIAKDGKSLPADFVVFATGYKPLAELLSKLLGDEVARRLGAIWGLGSGRPGDHGPWEGELRNMWKPTPVEGLWIHGGNLMQNRIYSHYLAMQIKARYEGIQTPVYKPSGKSSTNIGIAGA
jgi:putative flavoprotein involved in K+ transport